MRTKMLANKLWNPVLVDFYHRCYQTILTAAFKTYAWEKGKREKPKRGKKKQSKDKNLLDRLIKYEKETPPVYGGLPGFF